MHTRTHTLGISSHPRTISLTFIFVPGQVQDPRLNSFIMPTGCHSSVLSQLDTPTPLSNRMLNILSIAGPQSLSPVSHHLLPFLPITLSISLVPSANSAHPTQENCGTRVSANGSQDWAGKTQSLQETFSWASPKQRINF